MYLGSLPRGAHHAPDKYLHRGSGEKRNHDFCLCAQVSDAIIYDLDSSHDLFSCEVRLEGGEPSSGSLVDFLVFVDDELVVSARNVRVNETRHLQTCIRNAKKLELRTEGSASSECSALWIEAKVQEWPEEGILDCLGQVRIFRPVELVQSDECFVMMISPGYERWLDIFLNSLRQNGNCPEAAILVYCVDGDQSCSEVIARHGAKEIKCQALTAKSPTLKPAIFSVGSLARVKKVIAVETDMIVLKNIHALFEGMDMMPPGSLLAAQEIVWEKPTPLEEFFPLVFQGQPEELDTVFHADARERAHPLQINGGVIAGTTEAMAALDNTMRDLCPAAAQWVRDRPDISWREMFVTNFAMAHLDASVGLHPTYNLQLHTRRAELEYNAGQFKVQSDVGQVKVLHFSAASKGRMPELQDYFWEQGNPLHSLRMGLEIVRGASLEELRNPTFVANIIRQIGLQEPVYYHNPNYGEESAFVNAGPGIYLLPQQLAKALIYLSDKSIGSYVESGSDEGWTFAFITAYLHRFYPLHRSVALDFRLTRCDEYRLRDHYPVEFMYGGPLSLSGVPFDLVMINSRKIRPVVQFGYERLGRHANYCLFYNINDQKLRDEFQGQSAASIWADLKVSAPIEAVEFLDAPNANSIMGIGVIKAH